MRSMFKKYVSVVLLVAIATNCAPVICITRPLSAKEFSEQIKERTRMFGEQLRVSLEKAAAISAQNVLILNQQMTKALPYLKKMSPEDRNKFVQEWYIKGIEYVYDSYGDILFKGYEDPRSIEQKA